MVKKRVIPCLDVAGGRVVKGVRFENLRDVGDPIELATRYSALAADELVFLDITATLEDRGPMLELVERAAEELSIPFTVGGGVTGLADARALLRAGADKVAVNRAAFDDPSMLTALADEFGAQAVVCAIDAQRGRGRHPRRQQPRGLDAVEWAQEAVARGAGEILLTSIDADGTRAGYDLELTGAVAEAVEVPVIASGGAGESRHLAEAFAAGAEAALVASIVHERPERLRELKAELREAGWPVGADRAGRRAAPRSSRTRRTGACSCSRGWTRRRCGARASRARPGSGAARGRSTGTRARHRATRSRSRSSATTATATRSCSASARPAPSVTRERSRASRPGSGAGSSSAREERPRGLVRRLAARRRRGRAARKVGEEGVEAALAGAAESDERLVEELADLWFHSYVLLAASGLDPAAVEVELRAVA